MLRPYTLNIDEDLMRAAKSRALSERTSVSDIVRRLLAGYVGFQADDDATIEDERVLEVLRRYSAGGMRRSEAMRVIGLDPIELDRFNDLMDQFKIPWPAPDRARAEQEGAVVASMIEESERGQA